MQMLTLVDMIIKYKKQNTVQSDVMLFETMIIWENWLRAMKNYIIQS